MLKHPTAGAGRSYWNTPVWHAWIEAKVAWDVVVFMFGDLVTVVVVFVVNVINVVIVDIVIV